ncbi:RNA polymerase II-associated protein 1 isoform X2 [Hemicordylus capensis]|nr:RNA polymerase II-associated protein 1 isoform X2 [Hemicordylus capensis]XP_053139978.1 RNA polymerase II-associated protein 1 isoform X2 [Hemicordylus capensis]XP_053139979.1 RNA polymerase II-associated protein 1 isoform X2 [Hemicordylus capensis]XP_053139980.1 RNA polymerase II-associated protein 1 isoform X2 [Hemicordylus capensis]XP_053139981.1 RNA polymerase II-associated protein 1 isoform X2 [Hemicordylus capensis]XP_053139982.1 RNA polymerase II-associated protein 1 isoform X2 [Hemi
MLSRPKPGESEADLLRFQNQFLAAKASPAVKIIKKADKRRGDEGSGDERSSLQYNRDVVTMDGFPDVLPALIPAPPKKTKFKSAHVHFEDPEERLDRGDQHITAVFSKIIERDTSTASVTMPVYTQDPFPRVFHRSEIKTEAKLAPGRKSIFAQKIAARRAAEMTQTSSPALDEAGQTNAGQAAPAAALPHEAMEAQFDKAEEEKSVGTIPTWPCIVTGEGLGSLTGEQEARRIHKENLERLQSMSKDQILEEQKRVLAQLDPSLVAFLKLRYGTDIKQEAEEKMEQEGPREHMHPEGQPEHLHKAGEMLKTPLLQKPDTEEKPDLEDSVRTEAHTRMDVADDLPVKPQKEWLHMDNVEFEKLEWMKDLPQPRQRKTRKGMQARFSLKGELIPPDKDFPTHMGLHHHGEEADRAGYSLQELFHLTRSQVIQQRTLALQVLGHVVQKAKAGEFVSMLKGSVLRVLLDAGFLFLLRFSLDDPVDNVIAAAVHALHALLVSSDDEEYLDKTFSWYQGMAVYPFIPNNEEEEDEEDEQTVIEKTLGSKAKDENKPDPDVARYDVVKGLLKTRILHRLRYILEVMRPVPLVVLEILDILIRVARHSTEACCRVLDCPRLVETVIGEFLPTQWDPRVAEPEQLLLSLHGVPCATAMKLIRVVASGGRNIAARLLNKFEMKRRLSRFIAEDPKDLSLRTEEAIRMTTEAFRLWAVSAGYGQACDLYRDLYPVLVKMIPSLSHLVSSFQENNFTFELSVQRAAAMVTLLTHVTKTAGCGAELQAQLSRSDSEDGDQIPPPPVTWSQVSGFRPIVETNLKKCLKEISQSDTWQALQPLTTAYVIFMGVYYHNCSQQPSVNPIDCLEEVEHLTSEVLLPLLSQPGMQTLWAMLRPCSALCNPLSCSPAPESLPSIVSLSFTGGKPPMSLVGSRSPFPFLTALLVLVNNITHIHKGLVGKYMSLLDVKDLNDYLLQSSTTAPPSLSFSSAWLLHHEYHLQYFVLALAQKMAVACLDYSRHASLHHCVAMVLLSRLLPGSEHLAHKLLLGLAFNPKLIPEGKAGGPEAADFSDILNLSSRANLTQPGSAAAISPLPSRGALLEEAYQHLPSIQACYLSHFLYLEPALIRSRDVYQGRTHLVHSMLLPEVKGPILPSDWPFLPLISLYNKVTGSGKQWAVLNSLPMDLVNTVTRNLQWVLLLETWRTRVLHGVSAASKLARLMCVFLTGSDLFLEGPVHCYTAALLSLYCHSKVLDSLNLDAPLPGLASFHDLYINLLEQFESVSFGDPLFGVFVLLPLQRRFSVQLRMAVFGEHVSTLRALGVPLQQFPVPLEQYLSPPEDNLNLLRQYFKALVTGALRQNWCPVLYVVAVAHVNSFIFSQDSTTQEVDVARKNMLQKTWLLADELLRRHLLFYKLSNKNNPVGFDLYEQLPPIRLKYLHAVTQAEHKESMSESQHLSRELMDNNAV